MVEAPEKIWPLGGYAPGNYTCRCLDCGEPFIGDKRATACLECAVSVAKSQIAELRAAPTRSGGTLLGQIDALLALAERNALEPPVPYLALELLRLSRTALSTAPATTDGWKLVPDGDPVALDDCPEGLFLFDGYLGFMTEYAVVRDGFRQRNAYCGDSGEYFWGGTSNAKDRANLIVQPMIAAAPTATGGR